MSFCRGKAGIIFSSKLDRRKVNPLVFVKFWRQACLPSLLFGAELISLTLGLLLTLERCQSWFSKHIFHVPSFAPGLLLLKMSGLNSIASEIAIKKLLFLGRLITEPSLAPTVRNLFESRTESCFDTPITSFIIMLSISEVLVNTICFNIFNHGLTTPHFRPIQIAKELSGIRSKSLRGTYGLSFATLIQTCMLLSLVSKICLSNNFGPQLRSI